MNTLDQKQVLEHARDALAIMDAMPFDSFGPIDAVRTLDDYNDMGPDDREAVLHALYALIDNETA